jgi:hypothetical protein
MFPPSEGWLGLNEPDGDRVVLYGVESGLGGDALSKRLNERNPEPGTASDTPPGQVLSSA